MDIEFVCLAAFTWGIAVAVFLQFTAMGDFLSKRLTWFVTSLGFGGDLLLLLLLVDSAGRVLWWQVVLVVALSSIAPSFRGMWQLLDYNQGQMSDAKDETA